MIYVDIYFLSSTIIPRIEGMLGVMVIVEEMESVTWVKIPDDEFHSRKSYESNSFSHHPAMGK